jgi:ABC-2 type transport system ATP-binding protein
MSSPLSISKLTYTVNNHQILHDVSLSLHTGEIYGFLGPNGAGKTTTILTALGHNTPDSGSVLFWGQTLDNTIRQRI